MLVSDPCFDVWPAGAKSISDSQPSMIRQSAGRPRSTLELGAAEKKPCFHQNWSRLLGTVAWQLSKKIAVQIKCCSGKRKTWCNLKNSWCLKNLIAVEFFGGKKKKRKKRRKEKKKFSVEGGKKFFGKIDLEITILALARLFLLAIYGTSGNTKWYGSHVLFVYLYPNLG